MGVFHELVARGDAASPLLAFGIEAELIRLRRIDAVEADLCLADLNRVTVDDSGDTRDVAGKRRCCDQKHDCTNGACDR
jgi:hypothetical protein